MPSSLYYTEGRGYALLGRHKCLLGSRALRCYKGEYCKQREDTTKPFAIVGRHLCRQVWMYDIRF